MFLILQILQDTSLFAIESAADNLVYGSFGVAAVVATVGVGVGLAKTAMASKGVNALKANERETQAEMDEAIKKMEEFEFTNTFEDLEAQDYEIEKAVSPTLGGAVLAGDPTLLGDPAQMKGSKLGRAKGYQAQGYTGEGYTSRGYSAGQTNIGGLQRGAATGLTNTMSNLQVSTAGAEMAAREADQSLAASQDLAAQAGTGAGGATALAAAAAKSKAGISAGIDQQVKQNEMMRAQGESELQRAQLAQGNLASQFDLGQSQFNVSAVNQAAQFGASAANQAAQFGADARNQANRFSADANNQAARFKAQAQNDFMKTQFGADNAMEQFNIGAQNQFRMSDVGAQNQFALTDVAAQNDFLKTQFGADVGSMMFNAGAQTDANRWGAENQWKTDVTVMQGEAARQNNQYTQLGDMTQIRAGLWQDSSNKLMHKQGQIQGAWNNTFDAVGDLGTAMAPGLNEKWSDRRLKRDIVFKRRSPSGLKIYHFKYKDTSFGPGIYEGVMADEVPARAVVKHENGYNLVDYSKIDVDFKTIIH